MEGINTQPAAKTTTERPKAFNILQPYERAFIGRNPEDITEFIDAIKTTYGISDEIKLQEDTFENGDYKREFKFLEFPGLGRVFTILAYNPGVGPRNARDVFEISAYIKRSLIVYVHPRAVSCFKPNLLHNFVVILIHSTEELK